MRIGLRRSIGSLALTALAVLAVPSALRAEAVASTPTLFRTEIRSSTSLQVSRSELLVEVPSGVMAPVYAGSVEFRAMARTRTGGDVVLTVETTLEAEPQGSADGAAAAPVLEFQGTGTGTVSGVLSSSMAQVVGRWSGSGLRSGSLQFRVEGGLTPGLHRIPLRFVLSAP